MLCTWYLQGSSGVTFMTQCQQEQLKTNIINLKLIFGVLRQQYKGTDVKWTV